MEKWNGPNHEHLNWENEKTGDKISPRLQDNLVVVDFQKLCTHAEGAYCCFCISRVKQVAEIAEGLLYTVSPAYATEVEKNLGKFPEHLALVNIIRKNAFCMKLDLVWKISGFKTIRGRAKGETGVSQKLLMVLDYKTDSRITDANYIRGFRVRLGKDTPEDAAKRLWECPSSFLVDGEYLVSRVPLRDLLGKVEVPLERKNEVNLFFANSIKNPDEHGIVEVHYDDWIGYMLPRGSHIQFIMEDVPILENHVKVEVEFELATYTTRGFKKKPESA